MSSKISNIKRFDPSTMRPNFKMFIMGKKSTGKSTTVKDVMFHHFNHIPNGYVILNSERDKWFYERFIPTDNLIKTSYQPEYVSDLLNTNNTNKFNREQPIFLIMDDCFYHDELAKEKEVRQVLMYGRSKGITSIIAMQFPLSIPPSVRTNIDYIFIHRNSSHMCLKIIYDNYGGVFPDFETFLKVLDKLTADIHGCLVIDNTIVSDNWTDHIFWYRAELHDSFQMGDQVTEKGNTNETAKQKHEQDLK